MRPWNDCSIICLWWLGETGALWSAAVEWAAGHSWIWWRNCAAYPRAQLRPFQERTPPCHSELRSAGQGDWQLELLLNSGPAPGARGSEGCRRLLGRCRSSDERAYLTERLQAASWLERALERRATTSSCGWAALLRHQEGFSRAASTPCGPDPSPTGGRTAVARVHHQPGYDGEVSGFTPWTLRIALLLWHSREGCGWGSLCIPKRSPENQGADPERGRERVMSDAAIVSELAREGLRLRAAPSRNTGTPVKIPLQRSAQIPQAGADGAAPDRRVVPAASEAVAPPETVMRDAIE